MSTSLQPLPVPLLSPRCCKFALRVIKLKSHKIQLLSSYISQPCSIKDHSDIWPDEGMFAPEETRAAIHHCCKNHAQTELAAFLNKRQSIWGGFTLSLAGVGWSDGGAARFRFRFKWGFHGLPPDFRSRPCIYPNWPIFPPACRPCLHVNRNQKRGGSLGGLWGFVCRTEKLGLALFSSPSACHSSPLSSAVFCHLAVCSNRHGQSTARGPFNHLIRPAELE